MTIFRKSVLLSWISIGVFFIAHFLYFAIFNQYHLVYQEQIQLFRFDWNYFTGFLTKPGGLAEYFGAFFMQFYLNPIAGGFIITLAGVAIYVLSVFIFKKYKIFGILWSFIPVILHVELQSDHNYTLGYTLGLLFTLVFFSLYISIRNGYIRYSLGFFGWIVLYLTTGGFSLLATVLCIMNELLFLKKPYRYLLSLGYLLMAGLVPFLTWHYIYFIPISDIWFNPSIFPFEGTTRNTLFLFLIYFPLLWILIKIRFIRFKKTRLMFDWKWETAGVLIVIILVFTLGISKYSYNRKIEFLLHMDNCVQQEKWNQVLTLSAGDSGYNRVIIYFTNLALYKSGQLGDRMFNHNQIGSEGLWLGWERDVVSQFFGGEFFYHLGYINEAYRWAFEAMVAKGQCPRLLKQLVLTSLINGDNEIAEKYLNILNQTLFYRRWAQHYLRYLQEPNLLIQDQEIASKRQLLINNDFITDVRGSDMGLTKLLENHPHNQMAFEYYMASFLLDKNLYSIAANIKRLKDFGYKEIPVHFEEALLLYYLMYAKQNAVPEDITIRKSTYQRFIDFSKAYISFMGNTDRESQSFNKLYGKTYWYYFVNNQVTPQ